MIKFQRQLEQDKLTPQLRANLLFLADGDKDLVEDAIWVSAGMPWPWENNCPARIDHVIAHIVSARAPPRFS